MRVLIFGPFVGSWKQEVLTFLPFVRWASQIIEHDKIFISSHHNRRFLYDWIEDDSFIPVYEHLSRDEIQQKNFLHSEIDDKDYNFITNNFKKSIISKCKCSKKEIIHHAGVYSKNAQNLIINEQKLFKPFEYEVSEEYDVYIPGKDSSIEFYEKIKEIYPELIVIGDMKSGCVDKNDVLSSNDYLENGFKRNISLLMNSRVIVTPTSHWTLLANLNNKRVVSWGANPNLYRSDGIFGFKNDKVSVVPDINKDSLIKHIKSIKRS